MKLYSVHATLCALLFLSCERIAFAQNAIPENTIIWTYNPPACDELAVDGQYYRITKYNGLVVAFNANRAGNFMVADVMVLNGSTNRITIEPAASAVTLWKDLDKQSVATLSPLPLTKIDGKVKNRTRWVNFLRAFVTGFSEPDQEAQYQALREYAAALDEVVDEFTDVSDTMLKSNTLFPGQFVLGNILFQQKKFNEAQFTIQIDGINYTFRILPPQKR